MRIGLLGFTLENANKGCEALTYSFLFYLQRVYHDDLTIRYYSTNELYGNVKSYFPNIKFEYYQLSRKNVLLDVKKDFIERCDIVFDISFGDGFSDIYNPKREFWNALAKLQACWSGKPFVLLPQTYGPFNSRLLEIQASLAMKGATCIFSRDEVSTNYVKEVSGVDAITVTDLAFSLPFEAMDLLEKNKLKIGINVSGLLWKGGFYKGNQFGLSVDYQSYIRRIIEYYYRYEHVQIHLIPHVIEKVKDSNDGDLFVNELLKNEYPKLIIAPAFEDPIKTKNYIAGMDVMTAARMHATIDAFSAGVPVVPFAYSRKFEGLYGSLGYEYIVDGCSESTESAVEKTIMYINRKEELKAKIIRCNTKIEEKNNLYYHSLEHVLGSVGTEA